eukprot:g25313.t1
MPKSFTLSNIRVKSGSFTVKEGVSDSKYWGIWLVTIWHDSHLTNESPNFDAPSFACLWLPQYLHSGVSDYIVMKITFTSSSRMTWACDCTQNHRNRCSGAKIEFLRVLLRFSLNPGQLQKVTHFSHH